ncbi:hypothetical protein PybrP1_002140 [[Pythium] brassicae (nom. inval.)]|nr:hypothetical protein PybrP1_002140 [[Pythium] brassicae (nom. inval.)]
MSARVTTHYERLGVHPTSSADEIRRAYHRAARQLHPDKRSDAADDAAFVTVQAAYETLRDPALRAAYDSECLRAAVVRRRDTEDVRVADTVRTVEMTQQTLEDGDVLFSLRCRCGDAYEVSEDELLDGVDVVPCTGCSLNIRVVLETP